MTHARAFAKLFDDAGLVNTERNERDKAKAIRENVLWFLNKTAEMFEYDNLPATMPKVVLERQLQIGGFAVIWKPADKYKPNGFGLSFDYSELSEGSDGIYVCGGSLVEAPDPYGEPYEVIITNPGYTPTVSERLGINKNCIIVRNDTNCQGLYQLHLKYARLLTEAEISLRSTIVLLRDQMIFKTKTEAQRDAVSLFIKSREVGDFVSIYANDLGSPLEIVPNEGRSNAVELAVNGVQAIRAAWYNEIGLNPSFSLKREYTSAQEIDTNTDLLMPIIDNMFEQRRIGIKSINAMFGTNIKVRRSSAWKVKEEEIRYGLEEMKTESTRVDNNEEEGDDDVSSDEIQSNSDAE